MKKFIGIAVALFFINEFTSAQCIVPVNATVTPSVICPGQQVHLDANLLPINCGANFSCTGQTLSSSVGNGTTSQPGGPAGSPTILGNFLKSGRNEMLYTAAELLPILGGPCVLRTLAFNLSPFNSNAGLGNFTVKMTCTNVAALNTWENNLTTVYTSAIPFAPAAGWGSIITLTSPFAWDGVSNLIVDVCWYSPSTFGSQNNKAQCTTTLFNSYLYLMSNNDVCGTVLAPTVSTLRPNIRFTYCVPDINDYNVLWTPNAGINAPVTPDTAHTTANPIVTTTYIINVDSGGCTGADTVIVQVDNSTVSAGSDINTCPGFNNNLVATVTGTVIPGPASFAWTTLAGAPVGNTATVSVNPVANTTYVVTMNGGACVKRDTVNVNLTGLAVTATPTNITCNSANNGKIHVTSTGVAPLTFVWSANAGTGNVDSAVGLVPGNFSVTVTDAQGCSGSASATIIEPSAVSLTQTITNVSCNGGNNGMIVMHPVGGTGAPYTFSWSSGLPNNDTVSNLLAGAYSVTVRDGNNCSAVANLNVGQPTALVFNAAQTKNIRCLNGSDGFITVSVSGGSGTYTYDWSHDATFHQTNATNLPAGNYVITVTDINNCSLSISYTLTQPVNGVTFNAPVIVNTSCFGYTNGSITANPTGGAQPYIYAWNTTPTQNTQTATGLTAQSYTISVTDDSLCTSTASYTVNQPPQISINGIVTDAKCNGSSDGAIDITITNGVNPLTYLWSYLATTTQDLTAIPAGNYSVTVTDNTSCSQTASYVVGQPTVLVLNAPTITNVSCFGGNDGSVTANPSGGTPNYSYTWNPNVGTTQTISTLAANNYLLTVTDANGCTVTNSYPVTEPATALSFGAPVVIDILCNGANTGSITVSVSGGTGAYTYSWSQDLTLNNSTASSLLGGTYTTTVTDANNCSLSTSNTINQPSAISFGAQNITNVSCAGSSDGVAQITVSGGTGAYTYTWNGVNGSNPQTGLAANTYNVIVTDANSCTASTSVLITEPGAIFVTLLPHDVKCFGGNDGSIDAAVSGGTPGYFYVWSDTQAGTSDTMLTAGLYTITVFDSRNCSVSSSTNVNQPTVLGVSATSTQVSCAGSVDGIINAVANGGTSPFSYTLMQGGSALQTNTSGNFTGLNSGNYDVDVVDANGCPATTPVFIAAPVADVYTYTVDSTSCFGSDYTDGAVHVDGQPIQNQPFQYGIDGGALSFSGDIYNLSAGNHVVNAVNHWGCATNIPIVIPEPLNGVADVFPHDTTLQLGESIQLNSFFSPFPASTITSYSWSPSIGLNCIDCASPLVTPFNHLTQYTLTITYNGHCVASTGLTISVENHLKTFIPNSFSPNGDGNNDEFRIYGEGIKLIDLKVFNRWGEKVFETDNQLQGWDGTFKGEVQNPSVFAYWVRITFLDDKKVDRVGSVTLIR